MINLEYVNGSISLDIDTISKPYEAFLESCKNDINAMFADFDMLSERVTLESTIMGSVPEKLMMVYESDKKNIFARIGEMIVAIYNKFVEFIDMIVDKVKTYSFKKKSDLQKLDILLKNHPDLKNEAIAAFNSGALDLSDVKSLKELDSTFDEILKMAKKKDIDPNTLRGKWEKAKEKFEKDEKSWKVVKVAAATTTVITAVLALKTFGPKCIQAANNAQKDKQEMDERKAKIEGELKEAGIIDNNTGYWQTLLQIWRELNGKHSAMHKETASRLNIIANNIASFVDKFNKKAGDRLHFDLSETRNRINDAAKKAEEASLRKVENEQRARNKANREDNRDHRRERLRDEHDLAYHRNEGVEDSKESRKSKKD